MEGASTSSKAVRRCYPALLVIDADHRVALVVDRASPAVCAGRHRVAAAVRAIQSLGFVDDDVPGLYRCQNEWLGRPDALFSPYSTASQSKDEQCGPCNSSE